MNTFGSVMNTSDGPLSGLMPTAAAAGKIISPAMMAISVSSVAICAAAVVMFVSRLK